MSGTGSGTGNPAGADAGVSIFTVPWGTDAGVVHQPIVITVPPGCNASIERKNAHCDVIVMNGRDVVIVRREALDNGFVRIDGLTAPA